MEEEEDEHGGGAHGRVHDGAVQGSVGIFVEERQLNNPLADGEGPPLMVFDVRGQGLMRSFSLVLYVDFEGSVEEDENVKDTIDEISRFSVFVWILGCYAADPNVYNLH